MDKLICQLIAYNAGLQIAHFRADTKTTEHGALGALYDTLTGLADTFAEVYMGKYGVIEFVPTPLPDLAKKPASKGCTHIYSMCELCDEEEDGELMNILYTMKEALYKAKYLLKE